MTKESSFSSIHDILDALGVPGPVRSETGMTRFVAPQDLLSEDLQRVDIIRENGIRATSTLDVELSGEERLEFLVKYSIGHFDNLIAREEGRILSI